jgi:lipoprotein NlpI
MFSPCIHRSLILLTGLLSFTATAIWSQEKTPSNLLREGITAFLNAKPAESVAAFDKLIEVSPDTEPQLWQRGLSLYYAGKFVEGREQFELHQTVNANDVENAAWHFICVAKIDGIEAARKVLIPIKGDSRVPMKEVHDLFAGKGTEEDVMKAANAGDDEEAKRSQLCYAHLYLGLYHEALGNEEKAKTHMLKAAVDYKTEHYMGKCAQVHVKLRGWESK